jgi:hypothetical protein
MINSIDLATIAQSPDPVKKLVRAIELRNGFSIPAPSHHAYECDIAVLHECAHHALFPEWGIEWAIALKQHFIEAQKQRAAPWIPNLRLPFPIGLEEHAVQMWTARVAVEFGIDPNINLDKSSGFYGDRPSGDIAHEQYLNVPVWGRTATEQLEDWGIDIANGILFPPDDGFRLPFPATLKAAEVLANWIAIAERYSDRVPPNTLTWLEHLPEIRQHALLVQFP